MQEPLDERRSQLAPIASMCLAVYAYELLAGLPPDRARRWQLKLRLVREFWLQRQDLLNAGEEMQRVADALSTDERLASHCHMRVFLPAGSCADDGEGRSQRGRAEVGISKFCLP